MSFLLPWASLLATRNSNEVIKEALTRALDLMILGFVDEGTKITSTLYDHNALQFENETELLIGMYCAWSNNWPSFVTNPNPNKPSIKREKILPGGHEDLEKWVEKEKPKALKSPSKQDLDSAVSAYERFEIALAIGESVEGCFKDVAKQYRKMDEGRQDISRAPKAWDTLRKKEIAKALELEDVTEYLDEGVQTLSKRFTNGPSHLEKSIPELVKIMDTNYVAARKAQEFPEGIEDDEEDADEVPDTFLQTPASEEEIANLEKSLEITLPDDYKEFLRTTNGFYEDDPADPSGIFFGSEAISWDDDTVEQIEQGVELLPYTFLTIDLMDEFNWPTDMRPINLGAAGDEGQIWLVQPESVKKALAEFERVYAEAPEKDKRIYERGALDLYGGLDKMRKLEWAIIAWFHWDPDAEPYGGFKAYLEYAARQAKETRKDDEERAHGAKRKRAGENDKADSEIDDADENATNKATKPS